MGNGESLPMLPWFVRDYVAATRHFPLAARGAYCDLLFLSWDIGPLPDDHAKLARMIGATPSEFRRVWKVIGPKFAQTAAGLINKRLEEHRTETIAYYEAKSRGGHARALGAHREHGRFVPAQHQHNKQHNHQQETSTTPATSPADGPADDQPPSPSLEEEKIPHTHTLPSFPRAGPLQRSKRRVCVEKNGKGTPE